MPAIRPSEHSVHVMRRAARGGISVRTNRNGEDEIEVSYAYADDGYPLYDPKGWLVTTRSICRFLAEGWLLPGDDVGLFRARTLADGEPERKAVEGVLPQQKPTAQQTAILRRIAAHKMVVTFIEGRKHYNYGDGPTIRWQDAERLIARHWVQPESRGLLGEEPQTYVCRKP